MMYMHPTGQTSLPCIFLLRCRNKEAFAVPPRLYTMVPGQFPPMPPADSFEFLTSHRPKSPSHPAFHLPGAGVLVKVAG